MAHIYHLKRGIDTWEPIPLETKNYEYIGEIPFEDLDTVFRAMNAVDGSDIEKHLKSFRCRSLSVGDVVVVEHGTFLCERVGWKNLNKDPDTKTFAHDMEPTICEFCENIAEEGTPFCEDCDCKYCECGDTVIPGGDRLCRPCAIDEEACRGDALYDQMKDDRLIP